ncbi:MAG TPA: Crp/Fnr family transcriptional regulator [Puia sp.]|nr:Crp/Fnr family transcriptional regulator [Puia sp.]
MDPEPILKNIAKHISLDREETDYFLSLVTEVELPKKTLLLREGQVCNQLSYVSSGALRAYYVDRSGKESTVLFAVADWWITDMYCYLNHRPAMLNIESIGQSCILQIGKTAHDELYKRVPKFERFFRILMQNAYTREQLRNIENLSLSAKEKYDSFLRKYPHVAQAVTLKQIASYLGITPEFLSAVRKMK